MELARKQSTQGLQSKAAGFLAATAFFFGAAETAQGIDHYSDLKPMPADCQAPATEMAICSATFKQCATEINKRAITQPVYLGIEPVAKSRGGRTISANLDFDLKVSIPQALNVYTDSVTGQPWKRDCEGNAISRTYLQVQAGQRPARPVQISRHEAGLGDSQIVMGGKANFSYRRECLTGDRVTLQLVQGVVYREGKLRAPERAVTPIWHLPCRTGKQGRQAK